jgi:hypothetical protein
MGAGVQTRKRRAIRMAVVALGLAVAASVALLLAPISTREETCPVSAGPSGTVVTQQGCKDRVSRVSLLQEQGPSVALILVVPLLVAGVALVLQWTRWRRNAALIAGTLMVALSVVAILSIGIFYLPSAIAMFLTASRSEHVPPAE